MLACIPLSPNAAIRQREIGRLHFPTRPLYQLRGRSLRAPTIIEYDNPALLHQSLGLVQQNAGRRRFRPASRTDVKIRARHLLDTDSPLTTASARHARRRPDQRPRRIIRRCSFWTFRCIKMLRISTVLSSWIPTLLQCRPINLWYHHTLLR